MIPTNGVAIPPPEQPRDSNGAYAVARQQLAESDPIVKIMLRSMEQMWTTVSTCLETQFPDLDAATRNRAINYALKITYGGRMANSMITCPRATSVWNKYQHENYHKKVKEIEARGTSIPSLLHDAFQLIILLGEIPTNGIVREELSRDYGAMSAEDKKQFLENLNDAVTTPGTERGKKRKATTLSDESSKTWNKLKWDQFHKLKLQVNSPSVSFLKPNLTI